MTKKAFQDYYPDELSHCYGCGRLNEHGIKIKSYWDGETIRMHPPSKALLHSRIRLRLRGTYASLIDCHSTGTAAAAKYRAENREMDTLPTSAISDSVFACGLYTAYTFERAAGNPR